MNPNPNIVQMLIDAGADVNSISFDGNTVLMVAAYRSRNPEVVRAILDAGANATLVNQDSKRAFDRARRNPSIEGTDVYWQLNDASF